MEFKEKWDRTMPIYYLIMRMNGFIGKENKARMNKDSDRELFKLNSVTQMIQMNEFSTKLHLHPAEDELYARIYLVMEALCQIGQKRFLSPTISR